MTPGMHAKVIKALTLRKEGYTFKKIGEVMGCSRERVRQFCKKENKLTEPIIPDQRFLKFKDSGST